ncbi:hypothetical protein [Streptomyces noursei]|uniref:hypothetical protein n=1 Tax=Streptomyces noursei TaxID=1971 RepID=UPI003B5A17CB
MLVRTCHRRGAHAIGGMARRCRARTRRERGRARQGPPRQGAGDGGRLRRVLGGPSRLVPVCRAVFDGVLGDRPHQLDRTRDDVDVTSADLLSVRRISGPPTADGCAPTSPYPCGTTRPGCAGRARSRSTG